MSGHAWRNPYCCSWQTSLPFSTMVKQCCQGVCWSWKPPNICDWRWVAIWHNYNPTTHSQSFNLREIGRDQKESPTAGMLIRDRNQTQVLPFLLLLQVAGRLWWGVCVTRRCKWIVLQTEKSELGKETDFPPTLLPSWHKAMWSLLQTYTDSKEEGLSTKSKRSHRAQRQHHTSNMSTATLSLSLQLMAPIL